MALISNQRAYLTARAGAARAGAVRAAFTPRFTIGTAPSAPGTGYYYGWRSQPGSQGYGPTTTWTVTQEA